MQNTINNITNPINNINPLNNLNPLKNIPNPLDKIKNPIDNIKSSLDPNIKEKVQDTTVKIVEEVKPIIAAVFKNIYIFRAVMVIFLVGYFFYMKRKYRKVNKRKRSELEFTHTMLFGLNYGILFPIAFMWYNTILIKAVLEGVKSYLKTRNIQIL